MLIKTSLQSDLPHSDISDKMKKMMVEKKGYLKLYSSITPPV